MVALVPGIPAALQQQHYDRARQCLANTWAWYSNPDRYHPHSPPVGLGDSLRRDLQRLRSAGEKLDQQIFTIATFGLVSRGKSSVINALLGQRLLETGPLHGVTQWPRAIAWQRTRDNLQVEMIDTPGLDEIAGEARAEMAREVAQRADLVLFIIAGDMTRTEYQALRQLGELGKPLLLVFNKIDLYPDRDRQSIYQQLLRLGGSDPLGRWLSPEEVILVAAQPQPQRVRFDFADGHSEEQWTTPDPQIAPLTARLQQVWAQEGRSLMAVNALHQGQIALQHLAQATLQSSSPAAQPLRDRHLQTKALAIALCPIPLLDLGTGFLIDLLLIRNLAKLYGLPMTSHGAIPAWRKIFFSSILLLMAEVAGQWIAWGQFSQLAENPLAIGPFLLAAAIQGGTALYGGQMVYRLSQKYLAQGSSWGISGPSTTLQSILRDIPPQTLLHRLRQRLLGA